MSEYPHASGSEDNSSDPTGVPFRLAERGITLFALIGGYALLIQAVITAIEIIGRKLFSFSFQGVDELGGYALAITASIGFGYAALTRTHTRVDIVLRLLPPTIRAVLHLAASLVMLGISLAMLWYAYKALDETLLYGSIANSPLETPLWIPQTLWLVGFVAFAIIAALMAFRAIHLMARRDTDTLDKEFGTPSIDEEIASSLDDTTA
jgi:TRAP-type C4-dicarboxylate transport system permease small subunit